MTINPGDIVSHARMCLQEGISLQKGMNFKIKGLTTIVLMSIRKGAPYADRTEDEGKVLIYEGHDASKKDAKFPKLVDQPQFTPQGKLTENGKFIQAVTDYKDNIAPAELVRVYEKLKDGIWTYNGVFELIDYWVEKSGKRNVFKFKFRITDQTLDQKFEERGRHDIDHNRIIPTSVKLEVWQRDKGRCVQCKSSDNLHFDHILPFSKGGTSLLASNIQLLCARHNLQKSDQIL